MRVEADRRSAQRRRRKTGPAAVGRRRWRRRTSTSAGHQRDVALVAGLDLPAEPRLVPHPQQPGLQVEVVGQEQVAQLARPQPGQQQGQEQRELPVVARLEEGPLLLRR